MQTFGCLEFLQKNFFKVLKFPELFDQNFFLEMTKNFEVDQELLNQRPLTATSNLTDGYNWQSARFVFQRSIPDVSFGSICKSKLSSKFDSLIAVDVGVKVQTEIQIEARSNGCIKV